MFKNLKVLYSTNLRGNLELSAQLGTLINEARVKYEPCVVLQAGNTSWGTEECNYFKGEPMWKAIKVNAYDGVALGPDDFLHGWKNLKKLIPSLGVPATICNLYNVEDDERVTELHPYIIINKYPGMKVGLTGVIDEHIEFEMENTVCLEHAHNCTRIAVKKLKEENCDLIIVMAYMNLDRCMEMSQDVENIDLIICADYNQDEIPKVFTFHNSIISCENTKGTKLAVIDIDEM
jgi:2',3'-cyclic-nucleotide 2'-phosphodiesterase (5'-nucleotidase family)